MTAPDCPDCGSDRTVSFATGDCVCDACNHNWDPDPDANADPTSAGPSGGGTQTAADRLRRESFMMGVNTFEMCSDGRVKVSHGGNANLAYDEVIGIQESDSWRITSVSTSYVEVEEVTN